MTTPTVQQQAQPKKTAFHFEGRTAWQTVQQVLLTTVGSLILGLAIAVFYVPFNFAAGGVTGIAILVNQFVAVPEGILILLLNIPLLVLGFFHLGRWQFLWLTLLSVFILSTSIDAFGYWVPVWMNGASVTDDPLLAAVYGGIVSGIGLGLVYRAGATTGGSAVVARIVQRYTGIPLSQVFLYIDGTIVLFSVFVFGWEITLLAMLVLYLCGIASDYVLEGPSRIRTATIVTNHPERVAQALLHGLNKSTSRWDVTGTYSGHWRTMLFCTINRSQMADLKLLLNAADPTAFVTIGTAHQAFGSQFQQFRERMMQRDRMQAAAPARATADALRATPLVPAVPSIPAMATTADPVLETTTPPSAL